MADLAVGTTAIQAQANQTFKSVFLSMVSAAVGEVEVSLAPASQIGTALPTSDVIARMKVSGTAGNEQAVFPVSFSVKAFQNINVFTTGAGNVGTITLL